MGCSPLYRDYSTPYYNPYVRPVSIRGNIPTLTPNFQGAWGLRVWGFGCLGGAWGALGVLGFWGFGALGFWGFGVLGFWRVWRVLFELSSRICSERSVL